MDVQARRQGARILVVDDDDVSRLVAEATLRKAGFDVTSVADAYAALNAIEDELPDLVLSDVSMPGLTGFELVVRLRADPRTATLPVIFLTGSAVEPAEVVAGLSVGADDHLLKPIDPGVLVARIERRLSGAAPLVGLRRARPGGVLGYDAFVAEAAREVARAERSHREGAIVAIEISERDRLVERLGTKALDGIVEELGASSGRLAGSLGVVGRDREGRLLLLVPESDPDVVRERALGLAQRLARQSYAVPGEHVHVTPAIGIAVFGDERQAAEGGTSIGDLVARAVAAASVSRLSGDLRPTAWSEGLVEAPPSREVLPPRSRTPIQFLGTLVLGVLLPFVVYLGAAAIGIDLARFAYVVVVVSLLLTGASIWAEGFLALRPIPMPVEVSRDFPPASAVIAAYLPNEAATILDTLEAFLRIDYPADLQVLLAYNTPRPLAVEAVLGELAARNPRLELLKVEDSTSKAQNVNAAMTHVRGEFVGVFDADHQPARDAFRRAWHWLCDDYDVVQGHCVVRNGSASWVARTVAVEFEAIYAVSHPGRARLHGFGIFGGSNGYWRSELLRSTRMRGSMLTEDIDSSLRVVAAGRRIASDPLLISRELAPTTVTALWNQRMRWAQGWFQVSLRHLVAGVTSPALSPRQKIGFLFLLGWRELYPWIAIQMIPIVAFLAVQSGGAANLQWLIPVFVLTTLFTLSVGPGQALFAHRLAAPEIKARSSWFWSYLVVSSLLFTEFKNVINRISQLKEVTSEREWRVTPRTTDGESPAAPE